MILESYSLIPNVQKVVLSAYDQLGNARSSVSFDIYSNTANNIFQAYWSARDRDLKLMVQSDLDAFRAEAKTSSVETGARSFMKQCLERSHNESVLFSKIFSMDPQFSADARSAFASIKTYQRSLVNGVNIVPIATHLQSMLQSTDLQNHLQRAWLDHE